MQTPQDFSLDTFIIQDEKSLEDIIFPLFSGDRIFFSGDLGAGKSTFTRTLLREHFHDENLIVRSPTYTYYQKYQKNGEWGMVNGEGKTMVPKFTINNLPLSSVYHFDLYRLESLEDLFLIGARDILDDPTSICLIEWPEILGNEEKWTKKISIEIMENGSRKIEIMTRRP